MRDRRSSGVGAGIGGLAAAVGLRAAGWDVTVLERDADTRGAGAGISLWSNGLRALDLLGVGDTIRAHGPLTGQGGIRTGTGRWLSRSSGERLHTDNDLGVLILHRAELHSCLLAALPRGAVRTGATVVDVEQTDSSATVIHRTEHAGQQRLTAALVVVADGVRSRVRAAILPRAGAPAYAGFTAWRGVTGDRCALPRQSESWGRGAVFGLTQLPDGRVYWFATANERPGGRHADERAEVLRRFGSWHPPIGEIVRSTDPEAVLRHDIYSHPRPLAEFTLGRVALLGDAAHAVTPNLGQGGGLALEDAVVLASELAGDGPVSRALARYDAARRPRAERISALSQRIGRLAQAENPILTTLRDTLVALTPSTVSARSLARTAAWRPPSPGPGGSGPMRQDDAS
ncbi:MULTISPECIES: FAD-dependent monooxygenase [Pseudonocardia]|uniref:FAD-dependent urate hydroxylase n=2 Tax=Pseudonocardia TaxID=1847 RepID=A0A1Y2MTK9_PSEAH|nr:MULTISPECIES: FAD-dependent monooxygenase [Pseudonocardia]OSY38319.1 FAD-dependent urate hydroxylase [Pseudonocardia autotrophica]TDN72635.1 2-polyprenyl-6-methoxyphenol hydroxylase-like FAD-dependent oxidoreductase [Pseudonocardia autotrophica]BBG03345.1 monooxygenase [Pseudonocardia autotrophica]GEC24603.1 monooxygenase [Pseudonocardia saturnea]